MQLPACNASGDIEGQLPVCHSYTTTLTRLLLHDAYTPTLTRLLLHAYYYTPTLTRLLLHAYSYIQAAMQLPACHASGDIERQLLHLANTLMHKEPASRSSITHVVAVMRRCIKALLRLY